MFGVCFGIIQNFRRGNSYHNTGNSLLFTIFLLLVSVRQTLLDIYPRPGHAYIGSAVFGIHMPVWSIIIALCLLIAYAAKLAAVGGDEYLNEAPPSEFPLVKKLADILSLYVIAICAINVISVFLQCGFNECHTFGYSCSNSLVGAINQARAPAEPDYAGLDYDRSLSARSGLRVTLNRLACSNGRQKSAPDPVDRASDKKFLPSDFSTRVSLEADRAKSTRDGVRTEINTRELIDSQFTIFDSAYAAHRKERQNRFHELRLRLADAKRLKQFRHCSEQLFKLSRVLVRRHTVFFRRWPTPHLIGWNTASASPIRPTPASRNRMGHGEAALTTLCSNSIKQWTLLISSPVNPTPGRSSAYPLNFLSQIERPDQLLGIIYSHQISNIAASGVFNRESLASLSESVPQLLFKSYLSRIASDNGVNFLTDGYRQSYLRFLNDTQDPSSGYWGPSLSLHDGIYRLLDLSMTYHIIAYRDGCVGRWPQIIETLFEIKDLPYPYGWLWRGKLNDHGSYDIVRFFEAGMAEN